MEAKSPVLLITFNRPNLALRVLDSIRSYKPDRIYIASDGPRTNVEGEREIVLKTRELVLNSIDWDCQIKTLFRDENKGCGSGPASAISWLFTHEEQGIILEDDCIPQPEFFDYCNSLLNKYKGDQRVWLISGRSPHSSKTKFFRNSDYIFSTHAETWGWATWKRCWEKYDITMSLWPGFYQQGGFRNIQFSRLAGMYFNFAYKNLYRSEDLSSHVWDYQFTFNINAHGGLGIVPAKNLIENIGYEGTHFSGITKAQKLKSVDGFQIIKEPHVVMVNRSYDVYSFYNMLYSKVINVATRQVRKIFGRSKLN
ncbi:glycosyltransferase family protein [Mangrovibacterium diazotrophicum]|uniref:Hemolytic protein HlpA-like protein n=1 Tax=Mangrovibacterium diazotrophicum TaxID=1261403 RepID=A0A419VWH4_9BACT|nr:hypothetical protein [Mangrovibacterium diazotrophicum]RKD86352.1 hypothetical protein BC643_4043 [Mangrovibacterium diazotrophicum]